MDRDIPSFHLSVFFASLIPLVPATRLTSSVQLVLGLTIDLCPSLSFHSKYVWSFWRLFSRYGQDHAHFNFAGSSRYYFLMGCLVICVETRSEVRLFWWLVEIIFWDYAVFYYSPEKFENLDSTYVLFICIICISAYISKMLWQNNILNAQKVINVTFYCVALADLKRWPSRN